MKLRLAIAFIVTVGLTLVALAIGGTLWIGSPPAGPPGRGIQATTVEQRFAILRDRHSNRCSLEADSLARLPDSGRLQGACCSALNIGRYEQQLRGLTHNRAFPLVPHDPYDVSVALAKRLTAYEREIRLSSADQHVYDRAVGLAHEHGPCCCHCWRWTAFEGQAKKLVVTRHPRRAEVARLWDLEDGCGGV